MNPNQIPAAAYWAMAGSSVILTATLLDVLIRRWAPARLAFRRIKGWMGGSW
jgi:hypothetical protein